jgi:hypothetical protein
MSGRQILDRILQKRLAGLSELVKYLQHLPDRLTATLKVSSTIRFEEFLLSAQRRLRSSHLVALVTLVCLALKHTR